MNAEKQRIAIATHLGWTNIRPAQNGFQIWGFKTPGDYSRCIPRFTEDLNDAHEMEKTLTGDQLWDYQRHLMNMTRAFCMATAAQRAEAFLRTLNLWKEEATA